MNWDEWVPGDKEGAALLRTQGWLEEAFEGSGIQLPDVTQIDLNSVSEVLAKQTEKGAGEAETIKTLRNELGIEKSLAEFLAHTGNVLVSSSRTLASFESDSKSEWLSSGCCEVCDKNEGVQTPIGAPFPTGHVMPPACSYCLCCLLPVVDY
jgi:hypothetical protein